MKLEAVDRKNPHFICPATIGEVRGSEVLITFDGWRGAFDYWCRYDSRDIFPVGWCSLTGDNLQPPGTKGKAASLPSTLALEDTIREPRALPILRHGAAPVCAPGGYPGVPCVVVSSVNMEKHRHGQEQNVNAV